MLARNERESPKESDHQVTIVMSLQKVFQWSYKSRIGTPEALLHLFFSIVKKGVLEGVITTSAVTQVLPDVLVDTKNIYTHINKKRLYYFSFV